VSSIHQSDEKLDLFVALVDSVRKLGFSKKFSFVIKRKKCIYDNNNCTNSNSNSNTNSNTTAKATATTTTVQHFE